MSKPVFMSLHQGGVGIAVNMSHVTHMTPSNPEKREDKTVLYFAVWCAQDSGGEPLYMVVDEPIDEIAQRKEWHQ